MKKLCLFLLLVMVFPAVVFGAPSVPSNLEITEIKTTSVTIDFDDNTDEETDQYYIYYGKNSSDFKGIQIIDKEDYTSEVPYSIKGLESDTTYYIKVSAVNGEIESDTNTISTKTAAIDLKVAITDENTVTVTVDNSNSASGHTLYYGQASQTDIAFYDNEQDLKSETRYVITELEEATYYFRVGAYNTEGEIIQTSEEVSLTNGVSGTLLSNASPEDGCFIGAVSGGFYDWMPLLLIVFIVIMAIGYTKGQAPIVILFIGLTFCSAALSNASEEPVPMSIKIAVDNPNQDYKNVIGLKVGYYEHAEKTMEKVYDENILYSLCYERDLFRLFKTNDIDVRLSADLSVGYMRSKGGGILIADGGETDIKARLEMVPSYASVNLNFCFTPLVTFFTGGGPAYLYYKEDYQDDTVDGHIGGWHGKAGFKLYADDLDFKYRPGIVIEADYAEIDRMGDNDVDLGGLTYSFGFIYRF